MSDLITSILSSLVNGAILAIAFYIAFTKATRKMVRATIEELEKLANEREDLKKALSTIKALTSKPPLKDVETLNPDDDSS